MKQMNFGNIFAFAIPLALFVGWGMVGCNKSAQAPVAPLRSEVLSVSLPLSPEVKSSFLGYPSNNLLYKLTAPGLSPVMGSYVPSSASVSFGSVDFDVTLPSGAPWLLAVELQDAPTKKALALGATQLPDGTATGSVSLAIGSVVRNCYRIDTWQNLNGSDFSFQNEALAPYSGPSTFDIALIPSLNGFQIQQGSSSVSIAYMGNGDLVNFAAAPASGYSALSGGSKGASSSVSILQAADVYCVQLSTGHAWVQIINPGSTSQGPSFCFRVNKTLPYYAYDQIASDTAGNCITPVPTWTPTSTNTGTPTNSPTNTLTSTVTNTPTLTNTLTITNTPTITFTPTATTSAVPTSTPTTSLTPAVTVEAFIEREVSGPTTIVLGYAIIDVNSSPESSDSVTLTSPGGPVPLTLVSPGTGFYENGAITYTPGGSYTFSAITSRGTVSASLTAPGGITYSSNGSSVTVADAGAYDVTQVQEIAGPQAVTTTYSAVGFPLTSPFLFPNNAYPDAGAGVTYQTVFTAAATVFSFSGTAGTTGYFYGLDQNSVTISSNNQTPTNTVTSNVTATATPTFTPTNSPTPSPTSSGPVTISGTVSTTFGSVDSIQGLWLILEPAAGGQQSATSVFVNNAPFTIVSTAGSYNLLGFYDEISGYNGGPVPTGDGPGYYQGAGNGFSCGLPGTPPITGSVSGLAVTLNPLSCGTSPTPVITPIPTGTFTFTRTPSPTSTGTPTNTLSPTVTPTATLVAPVAIFTSTSGVGPYNIAVNSAGTSIYLSDNFPPGGGTLTVDGEVYLWTATSAAPNSYSAASTTNIVDTVTGGLAFPVGMAVDSSGNVYITDSGNANEVIEYNSTLTSQLNGIGVNDAASTASAGKLFEPVGVSVDGNGNVYASDNDSTYTIQSFLVPGFTTGPFAATSPSTFPFIAVNSAGTTIFTAPYGSTGVVNLFNGSGTSLGTWTGNFTVNGLAVAPAGGPNAGNLYLTDRKDYQVAEFNTSGSLVGTWGSQGTGSGEFSQPAGIAVDGSGNIYVDDGNLGDGRIQKFAPR